MFSNFPNPIAFILYCSRELMNYCIMVNVHIWAARNLEAWLDT